MALTGKRKLEFEKALQRKAWQMADQKKYTSVAINTIHKIDGLQTDPVIIAAVQRLKEHRLKLDEV
jgi:hypothetical protein